MFCHTRQTASGIFIARAKRINYFQPNLSIYKSISGAEKYVFLLLVVLTSYPYAYKVVVSMFLNCSPA